MDTKQFLSDAEKYLHKKIPPNLIQKHPNKDRDPVPIIFEVIKILKRFCYKQNITVKQPQVFEKIIKNFANKHKFKNNDDFFFVFSELWNRYKSPLYKKEIEVLVKEALSEYTENSIFDLQTLNLFWKSKNFRIYCEKTLCICTKLSINLENKFFISTRFLAEHLSISLFTAREIFTTLCAYEFLTKTEEHLPGSPRAQRYSMGFKFLEHLYKTQMVIGCKLDHTDNTDNTDNLYIPSEYPFCFSSKNKKSIPTSYTGGEKITSRSPLLDDINSSTFIPRFTSETVFSTWNEIAKEKNFKKCTRLHPTLKLSIKRILKEFSTEDWNTVFHNLRTKKYFKNGSFINLAWLVKDSVNFGKILDGALEETQSGNFPKNALPDTESGDPFHGLEVDHREIKVDRITHSK